MFFSAPNLTPPKQSSAPAGGSLSQEMVSPSFPTWNSIKSHLSPQVSFIGLEWSVGTPFILVPTVAAFESYVNLSTLGHPFGCSHSKDPHMPVLPFVRPHSCLWTQCTCRPLWLMPEGIRNSYRHESEASAAMFADGGIGPASAGCCPWPLPVGMEDSGSQFFPGQHWLLWSVAHRFVECNQRGGLLHFFKSVESDPVSLSITCGIAIIFLVRSYLHYVQTIDKYAGFSFPSRFPVRGFWDPQTVNNHGCFHHHLWRVYVAYGMCSYTQVRQDTSLPNSFSSDPSVEEEDDTPTGPMPFVKPLAIESAYSGCEYKTWLSHKERDLVSTLNQCVTFFK